MRTDALLADLQGGRELSAGNQLLLTVRLSLPAMVAQLSSIVMQYIDASMVGRLGAAQSASIGLVSSSLWLFSGVCVAAVTGFTVQAAQSVGAGKPREARSVMKQAFAATLLFSLLLAALGAAVSGALPGLLGGGAEIRRDASRYFLVFALTLPFLQLNALSAGMLQSSGNMKVPGFLEVLMCGLDVLFNALLIFPSGTHVWFGVRVRIPGAGLGVLGAALGTSFAEIAVSLLMTAYLLLKSPVLKLRKGEAFGFSRPCLKRAVKIALPVGAEQVVLCGAYVMATRIVSPLGTIALAANSFAVTAESLCYMPGYGIGTAAATLIGQSVGAGRRELTRRFSRMITGLGMAVMTCTGVLMYLAAPLMIGLLSPDPEIRALGTEVLRIEAFAEPLFAASIVGSGVLRGAGDTLVPSCMNFLSMWLVRLPLAAFLAPRLGLKGVWIAMCAELCFRGVLFLLRLKRGRWLKVPAETAGEVG